MAAYYNDNEPFACRVIETNIARGRLPGGHVECARIENARRIGALKGYGNAWVPQVAVPFLKWILEMDLQLNGEL